MEVKSQRCFSHRTLKWQSKEGNKPSITMRWLKYFLNTTMHRVGLHTVARVVDIAKYRNQLSRWPCIEGNYSFDSRMNAQWTQATLGHENWMASRRMLEVKFTRLVQRWKKIFPRRESISERGWWDSLVWIHRATIPVWAGCIMTKNISVQLSIRRAPSLVGGNTQSEKCSRVFGDQIPKPACGDIIRPRLI